MCRDCPVPNCGARYLVQLSNHLTAVHGLGYREGTKLLQEAKLQPKLKVMVYEKDQENPGKSLGSPDSTQKQDERLNKVTFEVKHPRNVPHKKTRRKECLLKKLKKIRKRLYKSELQETK